LKTLKRAQFVHILIKNYAKQRLIVVFSIFSHLFHKLCVLELRERNAAWQGAGGREFQKERTTVVLGAIVRFSALFHEQTTGFFRAIER